MKIMNETKTNVKMKDEWLDQHKPEWQSYFIRILDDFVLIYTGAGRYEWDALDVYAKTDTRWEDVVDYLQTHFSH